MKHLFCVKKNNKMVDVAGWFENKMEAKKERDNLGGVDDGFYVSRGPHHIGKHGMGRVPRMRRQPRRP